MATREENELLSRVGRGTPMGNMMRRFWVPAMRTEKLEAGGAPQKLRILGEDLVAFRASDGRVGVFDEACPHRGVSLTLARNADCALHCIFHGWKIDVSGKLMDVPAEPAETREKFIARTKVHHHPSRDAGGIIWVWLGEGEPGPFPGFKFVNLPAGHVRTRVGIVHCSWLNGLEGQLDSAHVGILHQDWVSTLPGQIADLENSSYDLCPRFEFEEQPYGHREAAVRNRADGSLYVRIREFVLPWYSFIPSFGGEDRIHLLALSVPIDDEHSMQWDVFYNPVRPLGLPNMRDGGDADDLARGMGDIDNRFGQSRERMKQGSFSGFSVLRQEDYAVAMAQGVFADRTKENLSSSDIPVVKARRLLLQAARQESEGKPILGFDQPIAWDRIHAFSEIIPRDADWRSLPR